MRTKYKAKTMINKSPILDRYCKEQGYILAKKIDDSMVSLIKPKPKWCPMWLYRKIIRDSIEIVSIKN